MLCGATDGSTLKVGQIGVLHPPGDGYGLNYDESILKLLTPPEKISAPGPAGWRFQAQKAGSAQITVSGVARCEGPVPCPLAQLQITCSVVVTR